MPGLPFSENKIYSGKNGKVIDANGLVLQAVQEFTAQLNPEFADVKVVGTLWTGQKLVGLTGTGTMKLHQIDTALNRQIAQAMAAGTTFVTQFVGEMGNDEGAVVRVLLENVSFTSQVDLVKFSAGQMTEQDFEFRFTEFRFLN